MERTRRVDASGLVLVLGLAGTKSRKSLSGIIIAAKLMAIASRVGWPIDFHLSKPLHNSELRSANLMQPNTTAAQPAPCHVSPCAFDI